MSRTGLQRSLAGRLLWAFFAVLLAGVGSSLLLQHWVADLLLAAAGGIAIGVLVALWAVRRALRPLLALFRALANVVDGYRDSDFSFGLSWNARDEVGELVAAHNRLGEALREQRLSLTQRELLLDTMVQNTPVAMLLATERGAIEFANLAARKLFNEGRRLEGSDFDAILARSRPELRDALDRGEDGVFSVRVEGEDEDEVFHFSRRGFRLNGRPHRLLLVRRLTQELRRQEVQTWKKVIRVMSHEMNNALGPIVSLARTGAELLRRGTTARLGEVLGTIEERANHLDQFLRGYAQFAKLPSPRLANTTWPLLVDPLRHQFGIVTRLPELELPVRLDASQFTQALSNLIGNAIEAGSPADQVELEVRALGDGWRLELRDRGSGMSEEVMARALTPFYSTKRSGTGLGLALAREIVEAHGGRIALANRSDGGLRISIDLPQGGGAPTRS